MTPHRRRWNGPPNDRLIQNTMATPIMTGANGQDEDDDERRRAEAAQDAQLARGARTEPAGEGPQQVGDERRGAEGGEPERLQAAAAGDGRQQRGHDGQGHADADGHEQVQGEVAPERPRA